MTTYTEKAKGTVLTLLNATQPYVAQTAGEGGAANLKVMEDAVVSSATTDFGTAGDSERLLRFPTGAKVKRLEVFSNVSLIDAGTSSTALVIDVAVVFSNSGQDGTPAGYQNLQPTTVGIGGGTTTQGTTVAIYGTSAAVPFGTITANTTTGAIPSSPISTGGMFGGEVTFGGVGSTYGTAFNITNKPLVTMFNFWDVNKNPIEDLGFFDLILGCHTAHYTAPASAITWYARIAYAL